MNLAELLRAAEQQGADELLLFTGRKPYIRGPQGVAELDAPVPNIPALLRQTQPPSEDSDWFGEVSVPGLGRFRLEVQRQAGHPWVRFRRLPGQLEKSWDDLHLPGVLLDLLELPQGLVVLSAPRGGGLSTTLAALLERLRSARRSVTSLEDGVQFVCGHGAVPICQREWPGDFRDWGKAVEAAARLGGVLLVPLEGRVQACLRAAEEGLLVLGYLPAAHSLNALDRISEGLDSGWLRRLGEALGGSYFQRLAQGVDGLLPLGEFLPAEGCRTALAGADMRAYPEWLEGRSGAWSVFDSLQEWIDAGAIVEPTETTTD